VFLGLLALGGPATVSGLFGHPLPWILLTGVVVVYGVLFYRMIRLVLFVLGLSEPDQAGMELLVRTEYDRSVPSSITGEDYQRIKRDRAIFLLLLALVLLGGLYVILHFWHKGQEFEADKHRSAAKQKEKELTAALNKLGQLQTAVDAELSRQRASLVMAAEARGRAGAIAHAHPGSLTTMHLEELGKLLSSIEGRVDIQQLKPEDQQRIQRARATIANIRGQYQEALQLLGELDEDAERTKTESRKEEEF
jgi:Zn-dependent protease with chaperone function